MSISAFFDEIAGGMSREQSFMALLLSAVWCDQKEDRREVEELRALEKRTRTLSALSQTEVDDIKRRLHPRLVPDRINELIADACLSLRDEKAEVRLSIFAQCADIVFADRKVEKAERQFLQTLAVQLSLDEADATKLLRALKEKNLIS